MSRLNREALPALVETRHLRYFVAVAEELHFTRAARRLNIAQPALSQQIRQLENLLGASLLVRNTRSVELTPAGAAFLPGARRTLNELERALTLTGGSRGRLRVGYTAYSALAVLPAVLRTLRETHGNLRIDLIEDCSRAQLAALETGLLDVGLVSGPCVPGAAARRLRMELRSLEPFVVALPEAHPLLQRKALALPELAGQPMVMFPRHLAPEFYDQIRLACAEAGFVPDLAGETAGYGRILEAVAAGTGVSLVPASVRRLALPRVRFRPLSGARLRAEIQVLFA